MTIIVGWQASSHGPGAAAGSWYPDPKVERGERETWTGLGFWNLKASPLSDVSPPTRQHSLILPKYQPTGNQTLQWGTSNDTPMRVLLIGPTNQCTVISCHCQSMTSMTLPSFSIYNFSSDANLQTRSPSLLEVLAMWTIWGKGCLGVQEVYESILITNNKPLLSYASTEGIINGKLSVAQNNRKERCRLTVRLHCPGSFLDV